MWGSGYPSCTDCCIAAFIVSSVCYSSAAAVVPTACWIRSYIARKKYWWVLAFFTQQAPRSISIYLFFWIIVIHTAVFSSTCICFFLPCVVRSLLLLLCALYHTTTITTNKCGLDCLCCSCICTYVYIICLHVYVQKSRHNKVWCVRRLLSIFNIYLVVCLVKRKKESARKRAHTKLPTAALHRPNCSLTQQQSVWTDRPGLLIFCVITGLFYLIR